MLKKLAKMLPKTSRINWLGTTKPPLGAKEINQRVRVTRETMMWWYK